MSIRDKIGLNEHVENQFSLARDYYIMAPNSIPLYKI